MAVAIQTFSHHAYNAMPHIDNAQHLPLEDPVQKLSQVLFNHSMTDIVGFCRTHKHLDLVPQERVIASIDRLGNKIVIDYKVLTDDEIITFQDHLIPFQFLYDASLCGWIPLSYWDIRTEGGAYLNNSLKRLLSASGFLQDLETALKEFSLPSSAIGICLRFQHFITGSNEIGLIETTNEAQRNQWLRLNTTPSERSITTHWYWNDGEIGTDGCKQHKSKCRISCDPPIDGGRHQKVHFDQ